MRKHTVGDYLLPVLALGFCLGLFLVFTPCAAREDGGWMSCHWAGEALKGLSGVMLALSLLHLIPGHAEAKQGLDAALLLCALLALLIPGRLIALCMMASMHCRSVMQPAVTVFSVLLIVFSALDLLLQRKKR